MAQIVDSRRCTSTGGDKIQWCIELHRVLNTVGEGLKGIDHQFMYVLSPITNLNKVGYG